MFVVAAERSTATRDGDLRAFIGQQIDAAKAPGKAHVLMRSGTDITTLNHTGPAENKTGPMKVTRYHTNPLAIPVKQKSDAYLSTVHFLPDSNREPQLKKSYQADQTASLRDHAPNYSGSALDAASERERKQHSNSEPVLPKSAKRWTVQRHGVNQRDTDSTRVGLIHSNPAALELKTKEELLLYLSSVEQHLQFALESCLPTLLDSIPDVN